MVPVSPRDLPSSGTSFPLCVSPAHFLLLFLLFRSSAFCLKELSCKMEILTYPESQALPTENKGLSCSQTIHRCFHQWWWVSNPEPGSSCRGSGKQNVSKWSILITETSLQLLFSSFWITRFIIYPSVNIYWNLLYTHTHTHLQRHIHA